MSALPRPLKLPNLAGLTLLVADDDIDTVEVLVTFLKACGASVLAALTVSGALAYIDEARKLDAVVTSIAMPGIDGVELARKVRSNPIRNTLPMIGMNKPVNLDRLASAIASLTRRSRGSECR